MLRLLVKHKLLVGGGVALAAFLLWKHHKARTPDSNVLFRKYVIKDGQCYLVRIYENSSSSELVDATFCEDSPADFNI